MSAGGAESSLIKLRPEDEEEKDFKEKLQKDLRYCGVAINSSYLKCFIECLVLQS